MPAITSLEADEFVKRSLNTVLIDVRSPAEYQRAHIPGARNIPLFSDAERQAVGKLYHLQGRGPAVMKGLDIAGPRVKDFVEMVARLAGEEKEVLLYCWRGGMRSEGMAWLLKTAGYQPFLLNNGYKAYRAWTRKVLSLPRKITVIGGMTGSGKTAVLNEIKAMREQVVDLEGLASHKGSVFGGLGMPGQPRTEHFENLLALKWKDVDPDKPLFLEDESRNIGHVTLPQAVFDMMQQAPVMLIDMPFEQRVDRLIAEYGHFDPQILKPLVAQLTQKLGRENAVVAMLALEEGDVRKSISIVLNYYDKAYRHQLARRPAGSITTIDCKGLEPGGIAERLLSKGIGRRL